MKGCIFLVLLLVIACTPISADGDDDAIVVDSVGSCLIMAPASFGSVHAFLRLSPETCIRMDEGARITLIYFSDGHKEIIQGPCTVVISGKERKITSGYQQALNASQSRMKAKLIPEGANMERMGGFVPMDFMIHLTMKHGIVGKPRFTWRGGGNKARNIAIFHSDEKKTLWKKQYAKNGTLYDGPALRENTEYVWSLSTEAGSLRSRFYILSTASLDEIRAAEKEARELMRHSPGDPTPYALLTVKYSDFFMVEEAIMMCKKALHLRPMDGGLHLMLSRLLNEMGYYEEANNEREKATGCGVHK